MRTQLWLLSIALGVGLSACGKSAEEKVVAGTHENSTLQGGKYQGKPDTQPWNNEALKFAAAKLDKGNKAAWEQHLKVRAQGQNDYSRAE